MLSSVFRPLLLDGLLNHLFSDKRPYEHLGSFPFLGCFATTTKGNWIRGALFSSSFQLTDSNAFNSTYTFGIRTGKSYLNKVLIPTLRRKAGVPTADVRGNITISAGWK
jgi:hypothetical protein